MTNNFSSISDILSNANSLTSIPHAKPEETVQEVNSIDFDIDINSTVKDETTEYSPLQSATKEKEPLLTPTQIQTLRQSLNIIQEQMDAIRRLLDGTGVTIANSSLKTSHPLIHDTTQGNIIEGVFDGQAMIGPDGKTYPVPPNYASKSKLVEGDLMKLTITHNGAFIFKQIAPTPRKRVIGEAVYDNSLNQWSVAIGQRLYKILTASATFYKLKPGDETAILIPEDGESSWGAVDNTL